MRFVFINTGTKQQNAGVIRCLGFGSELARLGHKVTILLTNQTENVQRYGQSWGGVDFVYTPSGPFTEQIGKLNALLRIKDIDVVHCMGAGTDIFVPALAAKKIFKKLMLLIVDYEDKQSLLVPRARMRLHRFLEKLSFDYSDLVICASRFLAEEYSICKPGSTHYLPLGFDHRELKPGGVRLKIHSPEGHGSARKIKLGYLGSLVLPYKDQIDFLLHALPAVKSVCSRTELHIIGAGPMRRHYERIVSQRGLRESVDFHGYVQDEELLPLLGSMDVLVLPFRDTPFNRFRCPHKVFLYASTGLPIVTNPVGEVSFLLKDYPRTSYFLENEVRSFCEALFKARESKPCSDLTDFYHRYSWELLARRYLAICTRAF